MLRPARWCASLMAMIWLSGCSSRTVNWDHVWKSDAVYRHPISDPMAWAATQFLDSPNATVAEARLESFEADIDHDGVLELFVTSQRLHGNVLGPYLVFRQSGSRFRYIGLIGMNRHNFRVLPLGPDRRPRVWICTRAGGGELGSLTFTTLSNDGTRFITFQTEEVSGEGGRKRYEQFFHE